MAVISNRKVGNLETCFLLILPFSECTGLNQILFYVYNLGSPSLYFNKLQFMGYAQESIPSIY